MRADADEGRQGVPVVDVATAIRPGVDLEDRGGRPEAADAFLDDRARRHRHLDDLRAAGATDGGDVDALIERPIARADDPADRLEREHPGAVGRAEAATAGLLDHTGVLGDLAHGGGQARRRPHADGAAGRSKVMGELVAGNSRLRGRAEIAGLRDGIAELGQPRLKRFDVLTLLAVAQGAGERVVDDGV